MGKYLIDNSILKNRKGYQFQGYVGNLHLGVTSTFKIHENVNLFTELEIQGHYHHIRSTKLTWTGSNVYNDDGSTKFTTGQELYNSSYNALGVAVSMTLGIHYRF